MRSTMVIPSYWGRENNVGWKEGDAVYDHPTPLDMEGTLHRAIQSIGTIEDKDFQLVIIAVPTSEDIGAQVEKKVAGIIASAGPDAGVDMLLFGSSHMKKVHDLLVSEGREEYIDLLQLRGYSNIRNLCMFIPHILGSEIAVLIDDDEVFEDPKFIFKAREFIGGNIGGKTVDAVAGYYIQPDGSYRVTKKFHPWMKHWDKHERMNEAFDKFIGTGPRLKEAPFVFGGNMVIHRNLFTVVSFDPGVTRGEDIDFLMNARMFGFNFFLDNQLSIKHLPPPKAHPTWKQLREDIYRFVYEREKIRSQKDMDGMVRVCPEDFDPYPGCFMKDDLEDKVEKSCRLLSEAYLSDGAGQDAEEALSSILTAGNDAVPEHDPFQSLCEMQRRWQEMMKFTGEEKIRSRMAEIILGKAF